MKRTPRSKVETRPNSSQEAREDLRELSPGEGHETNIGSQPSIATPNPVGPENIFSNEERWPQRTVFRTRIEAFKEQMGAETGRKILLRDVAQMLGLKESTLYGYMYAPDTMPSLQVLQRASALFGCTVIEFIDDPGGGRLGQDLSYLSPQARFLADLTLKDLAAGDLTDDDRRFLWEDHIRAVERLRVMRARSLGQPGSGRHGSEPGKGDGDGPGPGSGRLPGKG